MATATFNNKRSGCYLGETAALNIVNEEIVVVSGTGVLDAGSVLGKVTASGKYAFFDPALATGVELPENIAILFHPIDASAADVKTVGTLRGPATINGNMLTYKAGMSAPNQIITRNALRSKGMAVLPQHNGE
jgi:Bacteriophage lambda head decoration protein D